MGCAWSTRSPMSRSRPSGMLNGLLLVCSDAARLAPAPESTIAGASSEKASASSPWVEPCEWPK